MKKSFLQSNVAYGMALVVAGVAMAAWFLWPRAAASGEGFGVCLKEKGVVMYGVDTCENCQRQKEILGDAFEHVPYVNCYFEESECRARGVQYYPLWALEGKTVVGVQSLNELSQFSGCAL